MAVELLFTIHRESNVGITGIRTDVDSRTDGASIILTGISFKINVAKTRQFLGYRIKGLTALVEERLRDMQIGHGESPGVVAQESFRLKLKRLIAGGDSQIGAVKIATLALHRTVKGERLGKSLECRQETSNVCWCQRCGFHFGLILD